MRPGRVVFVFALVFAFFGTSVSNGSEVAKTRVFVSILPQVFFVSQVGGIDVEVKVLVDPGKDPHTFELTPKSMIDISQADVFFALGLPFERAIIKKLKGTSGRVRIVDTTKGVEFLPLLHDHEEENRGSRGEKHPEAHGKAAGSHHSRSDSHSHPDYAATTQGADERQRDPHTWLDPNLVKIQAENMARALTLINPSRADYYRENLDKFVRDLEKLDGELAQALAPFRGQRFYVYHPAFGYLAARYGLVQVPVEIEGKEPGPKHLATLIRSAKKEGVKIIFVQPQFSKKSEQALSDAIQGSVIAIDALSDDYFNNMRGIAEKLRKAF